MRPPVTAAAAAAPAALSLLLPLLLPLLLLPLLLLPLLLLLLLPTVEMLARLLAVHPLPPQLPEPIVAGVARNDPAGDAVTGVASGAEVTVAGVTVAVVGGGSPAGVCGTNPEATWPGVGDGGRGPPNPPLAGPDLANKAMRADSFMLEPRCRRGESLRPGTGALAASAVLRGEMVVSKPSRLASGLFNGFIDGLVNGLMTGLVRVVPATATAPPLTCPGPRSTVPTSATISARGAAAVTTKEEEEEEEAVKAGAKAGAADAARPPLASAGSSELALDGEATFSWSALGLPMPSAGAVTDSAAGGARSDGDESGGDPSPATAAARLSGGARGAKSGGGRSARAEVAPLALVEAPIKAWVVSRLREVVLGSSRWPNALVSPLIAVSRPLIAVSRPLIAESRPPIADSRPLIAESWPLTTEPRPLIAVSRSLVKLARPPGGGLAKRLPGDNTAPVNCDMRAASLGLTVPELARPRFRCGVPGLSPHARAA